MPAVTLHAPSEPVSLLRMLAGGQTGGKVRGKTTAFAVWPIGSAAPPPDKPFVAVVPGASVPLVRLNLPPGLRGDARETVGRRQLLDQLGLSTRQMELRPAPLGTKAALWQSMLMAAPSDLQHWRADAAKLGRNLRAVLPDYLALPSAEGIWTIQSGETPDELVQMRLGPQDGLSAEPELAALTLARAALEPAGPPRAILRLGPALPVLDSAVQQLCAGHRGLSVAHRIEDLPHDLSPPVHFALGELALDLASLRPDAHTALQSRLRSLFLPAGILALAGVIWTASHVLEVQRLEQQAQVQQDDTIAMVRRFFLPHGPLPDIRLQVLRLLEERRAGLDVATADAPRSLTRMQQASAVLAEADIRLNAMRLQTDGAIVIDLTSPDFTTLEALIADLRVAGLSVVPDRSASDGEGGVSGTMTIFPATPEGEQP